MSSCNVIYRLLIFRRLKSILVVCHVNVRTLRLANTSLQHQAFAFCGRTFCVCLTLLSLASCNREDVPAAPQRQQLQADTTWADTIYYNFDSEDEPNITLPDGTPEQGDADAAV